MELTFTKVGSNYEVVFAAEAGFNLHIERPDGGKMYFAQRTGDTGDHARIEEAGETYVRVYDFDFSGDIFPKSIKVVSETMPSMAVVTFKA